MNELAELVCTRYTTRVYKCGFNVALSVYLEIIDNI